MSKEPGRQSKKAKNNARQLALLNFALDHVRDEAYLIDEHARIHYVNAAACRVLGYSRDELLGMSISDIDPDFPLERWPEHWQELRAGSTLVITSRHRKKDGSVFPVEVSANYFEYDGQGYNLGFARDITERRQAEEEIAGRQALLQQIMDTASVAIFLVDKSGRITHANQRMSGMFGCTMDELIGSEYVDHVHPSERETGRQKMLALLASTISSVDLERRYRRKDGTEFWGHLAGRRFYDVHGNELGLIGVISDISKRREAEESLRTSEVRMRSIIESIPIGLHLYRLEDDGRLIFIGANPAADTILGLDNRIFIGKTIEQAFPGLLQTEVPQRYRETVEAGTLWHSEQIDYNEGGIKGAFEVTAFQIGPKLMAAAFTDITERKRAEEKLRESEVRFRDLAESLPLTVFEMDLQGRFTYVNKAALDRFGYSQQDVDEGLMMAQVVAAEDRERAREVMARRLAGHADGYFEYQGVRKDGATFPITVASSPIVREGRPVGLRGIVIDLSERKQLEEERLKSQKLESIGMLAGGIAHDFNNLLQGIFGYISMAKMKIDNKDRSLELLEQAEKALHLSVNLTTQLLTFSKGGRPVKKLLRLKPVIENAVKFALSGSRSDYRFDFADDLMNVEADEGQIGQVIQNIAINADQSMPFGGTVRISARNRESSAKSLKGLSPEQAYVEIAIHDSGVGIPKQYLSSIFDPYFTTKEKGSGIGLATSYSIIGNHGGLIDVESEAGKGSTFFIYLPGIGRKEEAAAAPVVHAPGRSGKVLVMDDDVLVRTLAREMIKVLGHEVVCVSDGEAAVAEYRSSMESADPFDVVILDLTVRGGMGGEETIRSLLALDPHVRAVVSSGYSESSVMSDYQTHGFRASLGKPYRTEELRDVLNRLLA